jgi:threonine/homoserine/homoserine lactone efflux protein
LFLPGSVPIVLQPAKQAAAFYRLSMVRWGSLGTLLLTSLAAMGSPGPATISLVAAGSAFGVRRSVPYLAGICAGTATVLVAVAAGLTAALLAIPALASVVIVVAAGYILWLAYHIATAPPMREAGATARASSFAGGLLLGVANPKAWIAIAAVFASARLAPAALTDAGLKIAVLVPMIVAINGTWLVAGTSIAPMWREPRRSRLVNVAFAVALVAATGLAFLHR